MIVEMMCFYLSTSKLIVELLPSLLSPWPRSIGSKLNGHTIDYCTVVNGEIDYTRTICCGPLCPLGELADPDQSSDWP